MPDRTPLEISNAVRVLIIELRAAVVAMREKKATLAAAQDEFNLAQANVRRVRNLLSQEFDFLGKDET